MNIVLRENSTQVSKFLLPKYIKFHNLNISNVFIVFLPLILI